MTRWLLLAPAVALVAGCTSAASSGLDRPLWCVDVDHATTHMAALSSGLNAQTVTTDDAATLMGKVASDLSDAALVAGKDPIAPTAQQGSDDAGRIRVSMLDGGVPGDSDMTDLTSVLAQVQPPCGDA